MDGLGESGSVIIAFLSCLLFRSLATFCKISVLSNASYFPFAYEGNTYFLSSFGLLSYLFFYRG